VQIHIVCLQRLFFEKSSHRLMGEGVLVVQLAWYNLSMSGALNSFPTGPHANAAHFVLQTQGLQPTAASLPIALLQAQDGTYLQTGIAIAATGQVLAIWEE
jgi:hypothetical protein